MDLLQWIWTDSERVYCFVRSDNTDRLIAHCTTILSFSSHLAIRLSYSYIMRNLGQRILFQHHFDDPDDVVRLLRSYHKCGSSWSLSNTLQVFLFQQIRSVRWNIFKKISFRCCFRGMALCLVMMFGRIGAVLGSNFVGAMLGSECDTIFVTNSSLLLGGWTTWKTFRSIKIKFPFYSGHMPVLCCHAKDRVDYQHHLITLYNETERTKQSLGWKLLHYVTL